MREIKKPIIKIYRYIKIYGISRTLFKISGRTNSVFLARFVLSFLKIKKIIALQKTRRATASLIGLGQFGLTTIGYFASKEGINIVSCFDVDHRRVELGRCIWKIRSSANASSLFSEPDVVYVASDHRSHYSYAIRAIKYGTSVHIEKPIAVSWRALRLLNDAVHGSPASKVAVGYNRPFSPFITTVRDFIISDSRDPIFSNMAINGHKLSQDHWYLDSSQGSRILGNISHWIDLTLFLWLLRGGALSSVACSITSSESNRDDNVVITIASNNGDVGTISLCSRTEPFEGISEQISIQGGGRIFHIDDFRDMSIISTDNSRAMKLKRKDVGHESCLLQLLRGTCRSWDEVVLSSLITLQINEFAKTTETVCHIDVAELWSKQLGGSPPSFVNGSATQHQEIS